MNIMAIELGLIAVVYVAITVMIQRRFSNIARIREIRSAMVNHQKDLKKMDKNTRQEVIAEKQKQMMDLTSEMMKHQLKASFIILPVSITLFYFVLPYIFGAPTTNITVFSIILPYRTFFIIVAIIIGLISQSVVAEYDKWAAKKAAQMEMVPEKIETVPKNNV